jgi:hypothetical protein
VPHISNPVFDDVDVLILGAQVQVIKLVLFVVAYGSQGTVQVLILSIISNDSFLNNPKDTLS